MRRQALLLTSLAFASGCVDTGSNLHEAEVWVHGTEGNVVDGRDGWSVTLSQARIAFGPVTFCPGSSAGEFCDTARGEWLGAVVVDALSGRSRRAGAAIGTSGPVLSWMFDYGLVSTLTRTEPYVTEAASQLDGESLELEGCATNGTDSVCFVLKTRVAQGTQTEVGVPVVRVSGKPGPSDFGSVGRLEFGFDAGAWLAGVDFGAITAEQTCAADCPPVVIEEGSQAVRAVQVALAGSAQPTFSWK